MNYKIVTDSSADVQALEGVSFASVPLKIIAGEREYVDDESLDVHEMLEYLASYKGKSHTSCPNTEEYLDAFGDADGVFCFTITRNLSGSYNAAVAAAEQYVKIHPERKIFVADTLTTGPETALLMEKVAELIGTGADFDGIKAELIEYQKRGRLIFALESLHNLAANGRVNPIVAKISGVLGIRVIGRASDIGTLEVTTKSRGMQKAVADIFANMKSEGYVGGRVSIHDAENPEVVRLITERIRGEFPEAEITLGRTGGLCSFYAERGGVLVGFEVG